jgi:hypothetical protein
MYVLAVTMTAHVGNQSRSRVYLSRYYHINSPFSTEELLAMYFFFIGRNSVSLIVM